MFTRLILGIFKCITAENVSVALELDKLRKVENCGARHSGWMGIEEINGTHDWN
jgi:hypothetical protein